MAITEGYDYPHSGNTSYVVQYTRGLLGVNIKLDNLLTQILCGTLGAACVVVLAARFGQMWNAYMRRITSAHASPRQQRYWATAESALWADIKKHLVYAPLGRKRHNREFKLSDAVNVGTLPSRLHTILLTSYILSQVAYITILDYNVNERAALIAELRGRCGVLAVLNMIPLVILAGRNNPLIRILHISFDTYNLLHRWIGRIVILHSIIHTLAWTTNAVTASGWSKTMNDLTSVRFFTGGMLGTIAMVLLLLHSPSPIRHAFYETFLHIHILLVFLAIGGIYMHLSIDQLPQLPWLKYIMAFWITERSLRFLRLIYLNIAHRHGITRVMVEALPGEASRVTFFLPRNTHIHPGSHVYAYLPRISLWMSHPFSVAWTENGKYPRPLASSSSPSPQKLPSFQKHESDIDNATNYSSKPTNVTLVMAARTGMTRKLYEKALASPDNTFFTTGFIEGPYRSYSSTFFGSYGTVVLFSGGAGITHHMMQVRELLERADAGTIATRRIHLIWSVRTTEQLTWVSGFMDYILQLPKRREMLVTKLFISKPRSHKDIRSPSGTLLMFEGRCRPDVIIDEAMEKHVGATAVSVCGPGAFADEVRAAVRKRVGSGPVIDFVEEAFTW
ncbi:metalloreductase [Histoplasma capsulatum]|uniref:Metalloreductase n=1 Tax=Ajellomyces capsulatus TaxID=5037 RepID=A0A8A1MKQ4_AJECA|nr:metalloreductase [Histoplasma capsulatum]